LTPRKAGTWQIPPFQIAFMRADMKAIVYIRREKTMAYLLLQMNPEKFQQYLYEHNEQETMYVQLKKALFGTLKAALLFC
jgi:hypothetical protein